MFSCDFDPEQLPLPRDPRLQLQGQRYAPSAANRESKEEGSSEQPVPTDECQSASTDRQLNRAADGEHEQNTPSKPGNDTTVLSDVPEATGSGTAHTQSPRDIPTAGSPVAETRAQQREHQLMLERRLSLGTRAASGPSQLQTFLPPQPAAILAGNNQHAGNSVSLEQQEAVGRIPEQHQRHQVPPFIIRKKTTTQNMGTAPPSRQQPTISPQPPQPPRPNSPTRSPPNDQQINTRKDSDLETFYAVKGEESR